MFISMRNRKGSALMQVLVLGSVIATIVLLVLRFAMSRTTNVVKTKRRVVSKAVAEACYAQINAIITARELAGKPLVTFDSENKPKNLSCTVGPETYTVTIQSRTCEGVNNASSPCFQYSMDVDMKAIENRQNIWQ